MAIESSGPVLLSLGHISDFFLRYAATLAALGAMTVAIIEAWKKLLDSQAKFHRASLLRWMHNDAGKDSHYFTTAATPTRAADLPPFDAGRAYDQLLHLCTGVGQPGAELRTRHTKSMERAQHGRYQRSIEYALYELEIDRLMGQIQDAADITLHNPRRYPDLFQFLTRSAAPEDVAQWLNEVQQLASQNNASEQLRKDIADRYTRLKQLVRRHLDSFQIVTAMRWREWNQLAAVLVGGVLLFAAQLLALAHLDDGGWKPWSVFIAHFTAQPLLALKIALIAVFGGMLAPVAKDLVDALRKVKTGV